MGGIFETLSGAKGLRAEGKSAQNIAEYNAKVAEQQAEAELAAGAFKQIRQAKKGERIKSSLIADIGGAGGVPGTGTGLLLESEQADELELENLLIGYESEVSARRSESQATLDRLQGRLAKMRGKNLARAANVQFGTQLLTGFL